MYYFTKYQQKLRLYNNQIDYLEFEGTMIDYLNTLPLFNDFHCPYPSWCQLIKDVTKNQKQFYQLPYFNRQSLWTPMGTASSNQTQWLNLAQLQKIKQAQGKTYLIYLEHNIHVPYDAKTIRAHLKKSAQIIALFEQVCQTNYYFQNTQFTRHNPLLTSYYKQTKSAPIINITPETILHSLLSKI